MKIAIAVTIVLSVFAYGMRPSDSMKMPGAYKMLSQYINDTTVKGTNQLKIYTADHMMYANLSSNDGVSSFGIGTYTASGSKVTENVIYRGADTSINTTAAPAKLDIKKTARG